ncbi:hypothetical protein PNOK_0255900 [Pyrrhoderma noxium]|uniref:Uncharacterized protein n=1 Tax=Pyrrhoderma noxium TaxID=2282107 RepID=A0A286USV0_9AGAM|nr:hypothetical protein PNOK_0255900 [Pyrrhoderma noxium]
MTIRNFQTTGTDVGGSHFPFSIHRRITPSPSSSFTPWRIATQVVVPASSPLRRAMSRVSSPNTSGLPPQESKKLPERQAEPSEQKIISALKELYSCRPRESTYEVYNKDAVFQDPVGIATGADSIASQFNALVKVVVLFPRADIEKFRILKNPDGLPPGTILVDQDIAYYRDPNASSPTKTLNSLLTVFTDDKHMITRHVEEWDHLKDSSKEDGFFGTLNDHRKKITASLVNKLFHM